jgi:cation diffusion facilitator CzcD-associated flavoprotein CzcO
LTDAEWAREAFSKPGWQKQRAENFTAFVHDFPKKPDVNLVNDGWTRMPTYSALAGTPKAECRTPEEIQKHVEYLYALDLPRQESIRGRVDEVVTDPITAAKLKPWYPSWCKRPCFHDEYLNAFNSAHVKLIDTDGRSVKEITKDGLVIDDIEHKVDILILSTGYQSPVLYSPPGRVGIDVKGRNGISFDKKWGNAVTTLHGMMSHNFPNLFWPGLNQSGGGPNFVTCIDASAIHIAQIIALAAKRQPAAISNVAHPDSYRYNFLVEATAAGEEEWAQRIVSQAGAFAATAGCTPSYFNAEGQLLRDASPEEQLSRARAALWAKGPLDFVEFLTDWRAGEKLEGLEITPIC